MAKVLIVCSLFPPDIAGGAEISTELLARGLSDWGHEVCVLSCSDRPSFCRNDGKLKVYELPHAAGFNPFRNNRNKGWRKVKFWLHDSLLSTAQRRYSSILKSIAPDILITNNILGIGPGIWVEAHIARIPVIHVLRDYSLLCKVPSMQCGNTHCASQCYSCKAWTLAFRIFNSAVSHIVGISDHILQKHLNAGYFRSVSSTNVIGNIVIRSSAISRAHYARKGIGYLGRISREKGVSELIRGVGLARNLGFCCILKIAGPSQDPNYSAELRELAENSGSVEFYGEVNSARFLEEIDFLVVPSLWEEPFGRVVIEAFAAGVPVLASNRGGLPELIAEGKNGYLFDPSDLNRFARLLTNLERFTEEQYIQLSNNASASAQEYSSEFIVNKFNEIIKTCVTK